MQTVLIVEDNLTLSNFTARGLAAHLTDSPLDIVCALSCQNARSLLARITPVVAIVDKNLPDGSGLAFIAEIARQAPRCRIILVTADPMAVPPTGACAVFTKPFEIRELARAVARNLPGDSAAPSCAATETPAKEKTVIDRHLIKNRLSGLLAGLRAFGADLEAEAEHPEAVREAVEFYVDRLCASVVEISDLLGEQRRP
jgi:DNA-binding response OmpR family regulator